jgi:hypothetical protein
MQLARFLVEAVVLGKQSPNQLVREYPISRSWFYELLARYRRDGPASLEPKSHRPVACPHQVDQAVVNAILELRAELTAAGLDAGPQTILHHRSHPGRAGRFDRHVARGCRTGAGGAPNREDDHHGAGHGANREPDPPCQHRPRLRDLKRLL